MILSHTEKKRPRANFGTRPEAIDMPYLLQMQIDLYNRFLQKDVKPHEREPSGLQRAFLNIFPVESNNGIAEMTFHGYELEDPMFTVRECKERNLNYSAKIKVHMRLHIRSREDRTKVKDVRDEKNVYMGDIPLMTDNGSFIINGTERVIVSQLHRAPSVYFTRDSSRQTSSKLNLLGSVIPNSGGRLDLEFDSKEHLYFRVAKRPKIYVTMLLRALGYSIEDIIREFYDAEEFVIGDKADDNKYKLVREFLRSQMFPADIKTKDGELVIQQGVRVKNADLDKLEKSGTESVVVPDSFIADVRRAYEDVTHSFTDKETGERVTAKIVGINEPITDRVLADMRKHGIKKLKTIYYNDNDCGLHMANTLRAQENDIQLRDVNHAREAIFRHLHPGDPAKPPEIVAKVFNDTFFNPERFNISKVGRMKINQRLGHGVEVRPTKMGGHVHKPRPEMEWCVVVARSTKSKVMPKFDVLRAAISSEQLNDEDLARVIRDIKDEGPRVVSWHLPSKERADRVARAVRATGLSAEVREQTVLSRHDILNTIKMLINLVNRHGHTDDIDSLGNRRIRMVGEFIQQEYEGGLRRFQKAVLDRMQQPDIENMKPSDLVNAKTIAQGVRDFFNSNQLSQFMDQTNLLAELTHKRRVSALGTGGLQRDRAGFEVRDVHPTHYGRLCPIETPEGPNIGLINSFALFSKMNEYGFITTPYRVVEEGRVTDQIAWLSAVDEADNYIAEANSAIRPNGEFVASQVTCRHAGEFTDARPDEIKYMDVAPSQIASVAAALIPFLGHDDSNRALMGSNMQRQAVPCVRPQKPLVGTGLEGKVAADSGHVVKARRAGTIVSVDASRIVVRAAKSSQDEFGVDIYNLTKYMRSNQNTTINQKPIVRSGDEVKEDDVIADSSASDNGELALGQNVVVAYMPWNGYNFEDSILVSERMVEEDRFTTVHIEEHVCKARDTRNGPETITRDIPNQPESALAYLDESGIIQIGAEVNPGDILVGKVSPKAESQQTPEEQLLRAIFGNKGDDVKDTSLRMLSGSPSTVVDVKVFTSSVVERDERAKTIIRQELEAYRKDLDAMLAIYQENADDEKGRIAVGKAVAKAVGKLRAGAKVTKAWWRDASEDDRDKVALKDEKAQRALEVINERINKRTKEIEEDYRRQKRKLERNDDLATGVNKNIKVYLAIKRPLRVGDKMAGRHGNKGVVSKIVPVEDMPYLEDGTPVDLVLNLLGVPSRMNIGQILETHLGLAAKGLGDRIAGVLEKERSKAVAELRKLLPQIYARKGKSLPVDFAQFTDDELIEAARNLSDGVPFATPIFDGATEEDIGEMLKLAGKPATAQVKLFDGRTGEPFERPVTVGHKYMFKLHHLVDEKMHARSTGPYSLVTQQPLGGKAQGGGQRLGEMEVWALQAYGAAYTLWEMLTVKSDDREGRNEIYKSICSGSVEINPRVPESYKVLKSELRALCIDYQEE